MRHVAIALALLAVAACDDADTVPVQPSKTASSVTLTAFPTTVLRSGSDVRITARVTDDQGALIEGSALTFTTTSGSLSPSSATTSSSGTTSVTLSASDAAHVTASLSTGATAAIDLPAVVPFTLTLDRPSTILVDGATFGVQITPNSAVVNPPAPSALTFNCGFGSAVDVTATRSHRCVFPSAGDFMVEAAARTANGWTLTERAQVTAVTSGTSVPPSGSTGTLTLSVTNVTSREMRITATSTVLIREFRFIFEGREDGPAATHRFDGPGGFSASAQHRYPDPPPQSYTARVSAEPADRSPAITADITVTLP